jgi:hypothetical protein
MSIVNEILSNPKAASAVSVTTTTTGVATWLDWIPNDIGKLATLIGGVLSIVLIVYWSQRTVTEIMKSRIDIERDRLELEKERRKFENDAP